MSQYSPPPFPAFLGADPEHDDPAEDEQPVVGASDARADARRSGADDPAGHFPGSGPPDCRDSDGVPVGSADARADAERTGADPDAAV